jgi:hypothetical protein
VILKRRFYGHRLPSSQRPKGTRGIEGIVIEQ